MMTPDKNKRLKALTDKNGVQTHRWVSDEDRGSSNADAVKRSSNPEVTMHTDPRSGNRPLFDEDELMEEETASGPPVFEPKETSAEEPEPVRLNGDGPIMFQPREGRAREPYRLNGDGPTVYEVDYNDTPGNDAQERIGGSGPPVYGPKKENDKNEKPPRRLNGNGPPIFETRAQEINSRLDEMIGDSQEFSYISEDGMPKTYRASVTTETGNPNAERKAAERQESKDRWRDRIGSLFGRRRR